MNKFEVKTNSKIVEIECGNLKPQPDGTLLAINFTDNNVEVVGGFAAGQWEYYLKVS